MLLCFRDHGQASPVALALFVRIICVLAPGSSALVKGRLRAAVSLSCTAFLPPARCQPRGADASRAFAPVLWPKEPYVSCTCFISAWLIRDGKTAEDHVRSTSGSPTNASIQCAGFTHDTDCDEFVAYSGHSGPAPSLHLRPSPLCPRAMDMAAVNKEGTKQSYGAYQGILLSALGPRLIHIMSVHRESARPQERAQDLAPYKRKRGHRQPEANVAH